MSFLMWFPPEVPVYLSSQSYMADSSLSEEMSQFDFSTGVQSFSFSSQNPEGHRSMVAKRVSHVYYVLYIRISTVACYLQHKTEYNSVLIKIKKTCCTSRKQQRTQILPRMQWWISKWMS